MDVSNQSPKIRIEVADPDFLPEATLLAEQLHLPCEGVAEFILQSGRDGLQLVELGKRFVRPLKVDFVSGAVNHRRKFGGGQGQMIARAAGVFPGNRPFILDATAGLGRDAFVLASLGCRVALIERSLVIHALLKDGIRRAKVDEEVREIVERMSLIHGDAVELMRTWDNQVPEVIYLDPMFAERKKTALVKREMRVFQQLAGNGSDAHILLETALSLASHRVVVKRPRKAPGIFGPSPAYSIKGQSNRFDVYPKKSLRK